MERVPDEVIVGEILSRIRNAREVVVASTTCKRWRRAMQFYLKSLCFDIGHFQDLRHVLEDAETIITQTIMQTKGLDTLSIDWNDGCSILVPFSAVSAAKVRAWLMHTKDTLRAFGLFADIYPRINIFEKCQWSKLEFLALAHYSFPNVGISDMEPFPCLTTLRLMDVEVSALNLSKFIALCPKIESLSFMAVDLESGATLEWFIHTLKHISVAAMSLERFVLKADSLDLLRFQCCEFQFFKLVGNEALKDLVIRNSSISYFDVGENIKNLENVDVNNSRIKGPELHHMISHSSNLKRLRLWHCNGDSFSGFTKLEIISASFPQLTHLSLYYLEEVDPSLQGSSLLQNLIELEVHFASCRLFSDRVGGFLDKCPNLKKMIVHVFNCRDEGSASGSGSGVGGGFLDKCASLKKKIVHMFNGRDDSSGELHKFLPELSASPFMIELRRKYPQVVFEFKYE